MNNTTFLPIAIFDFDSTIVRVETLDELASIALQHSEQGESVVHAIREITNAGMAGLLSFSEALDKRFQLLQAHSSYLAATIELLRQEIDSSFMQEINRLRKLTSHLYIVSGGFTECIMPVMQPFGFATEDIFANSLILNTEGIIIGVNPDNPLAHSGGKISVVQHIRNNHTNAPVVMIGDGFTDMEVRKSSAADFFLQYCGTIQRELPPEWCDALAFSFNDVSSFLEQLHNSQRQTTK